MKKLLCLLLSFCMIFGLVACSSSEPAVEEGGEAAGDQSRLFRYGWSGTWADTKNPYASAVDAGNTMFKENIYEGLCGKDQNNDLVGRLAESWDISEDGCTWTFHIRQGVKWHDGETLDAHDVYNSYRLAIEYQLPVVYSNLKAITDYQVIDDYTFQMSTASPKADMITCLGMAITPEHIWGGFNSQDEVLLFANDDPVGTGPFMYVDDAVDEYVRLAAFPDYWGTPVTGFDELMFINFSDQDAMFQALRANDIDYCELKSTQLDAANEAENVTTHLYNGCGWNEVGFNCWQDPASKGNPLVLDKVIRQAIDYAIDYDRVIEYAQGGLGINEKCLMPAAHGKYHLDIDENTPGYRPHDPDAAIALLEANGYLDRDGDGVREAEDGTPLIFRFAVIEDSYRETGLLVQADCKEIGIQLDIDWVDGARLDEIIYDNDFDTDVFIWGWELDPPTDPSYTLSIMITSAIQGRSDCYYSNPYYDELFEKQSITIDEDERAEIIHEMLQIIYEDAPYLILYGEVGLEAYNSKWTGWQSAYEDGGYWNDYSWTTLKLQ